MNFKIIAIEQSDGFYRLQWTQGVNDTHKEKTKKRLTTSIFKNRTLVTSDYIIVYTIN